MTVACLLMLLGCSERMEKIEAKPSSDLLTVQTVTLTPQTWQSHFDSYGYLESTEAVNISIDFSATIESVTFRDGQAIRAGDVLIELDKRKQQLKLKRTAASVESAKAHLEKTKSTFRRHRDLVVTGALSQEQFKQSEGAFLSAQAALSEAEAALSLAKHTLKEATIISPVNGIIEKRNAEPGQTVLPGDRLASVQVTNTLRAVIYVSEREVNLLRLGSIAPMTSPGVPGREYTARVESVARSADVQTGNFEVKLTVDNGDSLLRAGMSARLRINGIERENTLVIPRAALVDRNRRRVVFIADKGVVKEVEPTMGVGTGEYVPVLAGLQPGDQLVVSSLELVRSGSSVLSAPQRDNERAPIR